MSDNPLNPSPQHAERVEALAQELSAAEGNPEGRMDEFRERAEILARMEGAGATALEPNPMNVDDPLPGVIVEEASIQENLGEFPAASGKADQGTWRETPMTRKELREGEEAPPERGSAP